MAILADASIYKRIIDDSVTISPAIEDIQIQPASLDLRLGDGYVNKHTGEVYEDCDEVVIEPWTFYLAHTMDTVGLPDDLSAMVSGRSSIAREGVIVHTTAGWIDAGFKGEITLEVFNFNLEPVVLPPGKRVAQLVFFQMDQPADRPYGEREDSKYQLQTGPTEGRLEEDSL